MYEQFYNLREKPFNLTPSTRFLYLGEKHKEALAMLKYGVMERKGFILLTGEVGTGKTTMVRALLDDLDRSVRYVHLANPLLSPEDFMHYLAFSAFKKWLHFKSKAQFLTAFEAFLRQCLDKEQNFNLIIDEAHKLSFDLLEEIRLLSNLETGDDKLINIFLVGQPELNEKLRDPKSRALLQRISVRYNIPPLDLKETEEYMDTRWKAAAAGKDLGVVFSKYAVEAIHRYSGGYPRMINILADNALLLGYSRGKSKIADSMVRECYKDMQLEAPIPEPKEPEEKGDTEAQATGDEVPKSHGWRWEALFIFLALFVGLGLGFSNKGRDVVAQLIELAPPRVRALFNQTKPEAPVIPEENTKDQSPEVNANQREVEPKETLPVPEERDEAGVVTLARAVETEEVQKAPAPKTDEPGKTMVVKSGDTVIEMALRVYGRANEKIIDLVRQKNPEIEDIDRISVGQEIVFPPLETAGKKSTFTVHLASFKAFESAREYFQELVGNGYEAYIIPANDPVKGTIFRVALGSFQSRKDGDAYAALILNRGLSDYVETIELDMK